MCYGKCVLWKVDNWSHSLHVLGHLNNKVVTGEVGNPRPWIQPLGDWLASLGSPVIALTWRASYFTYHWIFLKTENYTVVFISKIHSTAYLETRRGYYCYVVGCMTDIWSLDFESSTVDLWSIGRVRFFYFKNCFRQMNKIHCKVTRKQSLIKAKL